MKVILKENIDNLGKKDEIKNVSAGFARNFLLRKKLAVVATEQEIKKAEVRKNKQDKKLRAKDREIEEMAKKFENLVLNFKMKADEKKHLFGGIGQREITEQIKKSTGQVIDEKSIIIEKSIKNLGEFEVLIKLKNDIIKKIKVIVSPE